MNKVILMGETYKRPECQIYAAEQFTRIHVRGTLHTGSRPQRCKRRAAVSGFHFLCCIWQNGEFAEKYFKQGTKIAITGRIQTGSYTNRDGQKIYTTDVVIEEQEFAESKKAAGEQEQNAGYTDAGDGFMNIPDGVDEQLPFA